MNWTRPSALIAAAALALAALAAAPGVAEAAPKDKAKAEVPLPRPRPAVKSTAAPAPKAPKTASLPKQPMPATAASAFAQAPVGLRGGLFAAGATFAPMARPAAGPFSLATTTSTSAADIATVKKILAFAKDGKMAEADAAKATLSDPVARKLSEWAILRSNNTMPPFQRYAAFIDADPSWPHVPMFRRRAENALWNDKLDDAAVLAFFSRRQPTTAKGRFVLARALLARGERERAAALVKQAWRGNDLNSAVETQAIEMFGSILTNADHKIRMHARFYDDDTEAGMRAAERLGGNDLLIAKAWAAVIKKANTAKTLLDAVPQAARRDAGYVFARATWFRRQDKPEDAAAAILAAPSNPAEIVDPDQWWLERRLLVRKLLDDDEPKIAYRVAHESVLPTRDIYRVDKLFTAGWIALRFLNDPQTAAAHFAEIPKGSDSPYALSRAGYWQGRAADAMGRHADAKVFYEAAARHSVTYYGQLARGKLGLADLGLRGPPQFTADERATLSKLEVVRAVEILYALDETDLVAPIFAEIGESGTDIAGMAMLGETAARRGDGRAMLLMGEAAVTRGLPLDYYAYPTVGLPEYKPLVNAAEHAVCYSIARQESHFNQKVISPANAMGLMQVTPGTGKYIAKKTGTTFVHSKLKDDPVYNVQYGSAELGDLLQHFNGSYILTFGGYNAGRTRMKQWIEARGDPRDPKVDPIDWVERIPFSETRNYVQRVMENLQVYRARFGGGSKLLIEADISRGTKTN